MNKCSSNLNIKSIRFVKVQTPVLIIKSGIKAGPEVKVRSGTN